MKRSAIYSLTLLAVLTLLPAATVWSQTNSDEVNRIIKEIDELYRSKTSYSELEMEIVTPHWQRTLAMYGWSEGMDRTFIRLTAPKKEKGVATLRIENEMWNYLPRTNKIIKIPPSMMMSSWMGSDFTNDDLVKEFSLFEDYTYKLIRPEGAEDSLIYVNCIPREDLPIVWGNIVIAARERDHLPVWSKYYDEKGVLMRVLNYTNVQNFGDRVIPATLEMIPQNKEGHKTVIHYRKLEFDVPLDDDVFSQRRLRSQD
ncbi:MAG: outer membrane lipoprotein-sorting protein [bacterium]|nr:outer membrane lipoprotein-sorting protein [bacterium]